MDKKMMHVLALIPARGGSKGIPNKNIQVVGGMPLLVHSIEHAKSAKLVTRIIVSTDSEYYRELSLKAGAEAPFLRPSCYAEDSSLDIDVFKHALEWLAEHEDYHPEACVHLRPTYPLRSSTDIDAMIKILIDSPELDSVRSVRKSIDKPYRMWQRAPDGILTSIMPEVNGIVEAYNMQRQRLPQEFFCQNSAIEVIRSNVIAQKNSMSGSKIYGYIQENDFDIDSQGELDVMKQLFALTEPRTFCFDIDGVIASLVPNNDYTLCAPISENIELINKIFDCGHYIVLFTARGYVTGIDWSDITRKQMNDWGVKHHELMFGKPAADYYIDDRFLDLNKLRIMAGIS